MTISQVGTPTATAYITVTGSATNTWSGTQPRTAGDILVMVITGSANTSVTLPSAPSGWTQVLNVGNTASGPHSFVAVFAKIAAGSDAAPSTTVTVSGTAQVGTTLIELSGPGVPVDATGTFGSGATAQSISSLSVSTSGNVSSSGEYAIACSSRQTNNAVTPTYTPGTGFTNISSDASTSLRNHNFVDVQAGPTAGAICTDAATVTSATGAYAAAGIVVFSDVIAGSPSAALSLTATATGSRRETVSASAALSLTATATGSRSETKATSGALSLTATASGSRIQSGAPSAAISFTVSGMAAGGIPIPTIPTLPAGYVVQLDDLQDLAEAATFLLNKPITRVIDETGGQAIGTTPLTVHFTNAIFDTNGMWASAQNGRLTVQTPGWYKVRYGVNVGTVGGTFITWAFVTTGPNNPAGSGIVLQPCWGGYVDVPATSSPGWADAGGIVPNYLYAGDFIGVHVKAAATGASTGITAPGGATLGGSFLSMEYVSI